MTVLDKYVLRKFIINLLFSVGAFVIIFLVVDLIENIDKFIDRDAEVNSVIFYYIYYIPYIINLTLPISMLLSCLFTLGNMSQHNEIVAQKSAGVSLYRIFTPLFILSFLISIGAGLFSEFVVPWTNQERLDIYRYDIQKHPKFRGSNRNNIYLQDVENRKISIAFFNGNTNKASSVSLQYFDGRQLVKRIDAKTMSWVENSWILHDVIERVFEDTVVTRSKYDQLIQTDLKFKPESLLELQKQPEEMSFFELETFIKEMTTIGAEVRKWIVELNLKISYPFANFIIILFGAPIAAHKRRSGTAVGIGISLLICFIYFLFIRMGQVMGHQGTLSPWLGAWLGNIIFGTAGLYTLITSRK
jgi:lipopolysaccharide export system permease protein